MTNSRCLVQILPSALDMPVCVPEVTQVSGLGAAMCAAVGSGAYTNLEGAMSAMMPRPKVIEPDHLTALEYAEYYQRWTSTAKRLEKLSEEMK